jgi:hypothetical protein
MRDAGSPAISTRPVGHSRIMHFGALARPRTADAVTNEKTTPQASGWLTALPSKRMIERSWGTKLVVVFLVAQVEIKSDEPE